MHTSPSGKKYIGLTGGKPRIRWNNGLGYKHNEYFFNSILKYGWDNFKHEILKENLTYEEADALETKLIKLYNTTQKEKGYNIITGSYLNYEKAKTNMRKNNKNKKHIIMLRLYNLDLEELTGYLDAELFVFDSIVNISKHLNMALNTASNWVKKRKKYYKKSEYTFYEYSDKRFRFFEYLYKDKLRNIVIEGNIKPKNFKFYPNEEYREIFKDSIYSYDIICEE